MSDDHSNEDSAARLQRMAAFGQLGAGIVHDLRNAVTSIRGFAQVARNRADDPVEVRRLVDVIERETTRCLESLDTYLSFARDDVGPRRSLSLNTVATAAVALTSHQLQVSGATIRTNLTKALPRVAGNLSSLQRVVVNLLLNATQAAPDGAAIEVTTGATDTGDVFIAVADDGPGVPAHVRDKIFEPFYTTKRAAGGTGLGLAAAMDIATRHGGRLELDPARADGATFRLILPIATAKGAGG